MKFNTKKKEKKKKKRGKECNETMNEAEATILRLFIFNALNYVLKFND